MKFTRKLFDDLNFSLDDLQLESDIGKLSFDELNNFADEKSLDSFISLCTILIGNINVYDNNITFPPKDAANSSMSFISAVLLCFQSRAPLFKVDSEFVHYRVLSFLITNLQAEKLKRHSLSAPKRLERAGEKGMIAFQLGIL